MLALGQTEPDQGEHWQEARRPRGRLVAARLRFLSVVCYVAERCLAVASHPAQRTHFVYLLLDSHLGLDNLTRELWTKTILRHFACLSRRLFYLRIPLGEHNMLVFCT